MLLTIKAAFVALRSINPCRFIVCQQNTLRPSHSSRPFFVVSVARRRFACSAVPLKGARSIEDMEKKAFERLPTNVKPVNYDLRLQPNLEAFTFTGTEDISLEICNPTNVIKLNSAEIKVQEVKYNGKEGDVTDVQIAYSEEEEILSLTFPKQLQVGPGKLHFSFTGILNDKMRGFYRSKYTHPNGETRHGAVTQFEATDARRAFPCWDEPAVKATFDVTLVVPKDRVALSNMPVESETALESDSNLKVLKYGRTPVMSTYLLAFVVGEFDYVEAKDADNVLVRVYTPLGKKEQGQFALEVATKTLPFYKDYFKIPYPLPKMDLIAIADFAAANDSSLWKVPVKICTASSPSIPVKILLLEEKSATVVLENVKPEDWVKVNPGSVAFYRTQYSTTMLEALLPGIRSHALSPRDRLGLQNDLFALAMAGTISAVDVFKVLPAFETEDNYTVWSDLATNLANMAVPLQYTDFFDSFKAFGCKLFDKIAQKLGWDPKPKESHLDAMLRGLVLGRLGTYGHEATVAEARKRFQAHAEGSTILPADLRGPTYTVVLKHGDDKVFEQLLKLFRAADLHEEKVRIMRNLGAVKQDHLIKRVLEFAMSEEVRSQDTVFVVGGATGTVEGRELVWTFLKDKWDVLYERYGRGFLLARLIMFSTEKFASEEKAKEIEAFFKEHPAPAAERTIQQSCENIRLNAAMLERDAENIRAFLKSQA
ncbi:puromycin-sensitive aminopeptidase-like [Lingula anatina]|uniref:Puromycin-sensitive aminopeptidase-like n=1 Tax=Lingula anatina TaxID=7574 RepID=A0A1S3KHI0_LINAN|nr:puromycin-sensitive aminopeptidase-like [Lingula anatina]|eukprot:XP_013422080.1 puromycin-sensitive aminopeptidase-like [Lingula anatina]